MKKFLSIFLTLCLMLTVVAVPLPAMAETYLKVFDFEDYDTDKYVASNTTPNHFIKWSGRVREFEEDGGNTVIKFDNNGMPYQNETVAKAAGYANSCVKNGDGTYTSFADTDIGKAAVVGKTTTDEKKAAWKTAFETAIAGDGYADYYNVTASDNTYSNGTAVFDSRDSYNSIELDVLEVSTTYRITINYKRESLVNDLYIMPATWAESANKRETTTSYNDARITIPAGTDSEYKTVSTIITTPAAFVESGTYVGDTLRLILYTGQRDANNVVYFDNITVEKITYADLTYNYADADTAPVVVEDLIVGDAIDYADLAPNKLGENNGKWYTDAQGTTVAPDAMVEGGLNVYEVVQTGVFDFNNYYRFQGYTGNNYGINSPEVVNSIYADGSGNIIVDTTKYTEATNQSVSALRRFLIAIGEAEISTNYKITVEYSYAATNPDQRLILTPLTCYGTLTNSGITGGEDARAYGTSVELPQGDNQSIDLFFTSADEFLVNKDTSGRAEYEEVANSFYLNVKTKEDGLQDEDNEVHATISKVTVTKAKGKVTYVIPEGATLDGKTGSVEVAYYDDGAIVFPEVQIAEGYEATGWTDANGAVDAPVLGGTYTFGVKKAVKKYTVTFVRGNREDEKVTVEEGKEYTLPDTKFTETAWWSNSAATAFVGYEGEKVTVTKDITYYTSETLAADAPLIFRNWTEIDSTGEDSYLYKSVKPAADTGVWDTGTPRVCSRIGVVEDNTTYRIEIVYKADTSADLSFKFIENNLLNSAGNTRDIWENSKDFYTIAAGTNDTEWQTATLYYTTDLSAGKITASGVGLDDTKSSLNTAIYLAVTKTATGAEVDFYLKEVKMTAIDNPVTTKGASILKDDNVVNGKQAIRYYFDYATTDGTDIIVDGKSYNVVDRGFIYTNGDVAHYAPGDIYCGSPGYFKVCYTKANQASGSGLLTSKAVSGNALKNYWAFDEEKGIMTYSTYVTGIPTGSYNAKMMVRGFVRFIDDEGTVHIVYSKTVNRSVKGIIDALGERH